jgi:hypothetical protein
VGGQPFSLHAEGERVILTDATGGRQELDLRGPASPAAPGSPPGSGRAAPAAVPPGAGALESRQLGRTTASASPLRRPSPSRALAARLTRASNSRQVRRWSSKATAGWPERERACRPRAVPRCSISYPLIPTALPSCFKLWPLLRIASRSCSTMPRASPGVLSG